MHIFFLAAILIAIVLLCVAATKPRDVAHLRVTRITSPRDTEYLRVYTALSADRMRAYNEAELTELHRARARELALVSIGYVLVIVCACVAYLTAS